MKDIVESLNRAMIQQGWMCGNKAFRIGNPFEWVDADRQPYLYSVQNVLAIIQYLSMFYEEYPTPDTIVTDDYEEMKAHCEERLRATMRHFAPFWWPSASENYINCTAIGRVQDYCFIRTFCNGLRTGINHLDLGPGLGTHCIYSMKGFDSRFYAVEASAHSYSVQRHFFRFVSPYPGAYLDLIECENFGLAQERMSFELNENTDYRIKHVPSWMFQLITDRCIDLVTATWILNETNYSGVLWLISHVTRVLRKNGYFYLRDSGKLKPGRHSVNYDELLRRIGFVEVGRLNVRNRIDYFGIPRVYQKAADVTYSFDELSDMEIGKFAVVAHGGAYAQNLETLPH